MYIHFTKNLIHRDIKPENVLLNSRGEVKITDFGISKHLGKTQGIANTFVGTIIYMSPERILNKKYSHNCDVWSFGLMMYELATGLNPYKFDKEKAPLARVVQVL
jgi:serine/threonine protein kinase